MGPYWPVDMTDVTVKPTVLHLASVFPANSNRLALQCGYARDSWRIELLNLSARREDLQYARGNDVNTKLLPHWPRYRQGDAYFTRRFRSLIRRILNAVTLYVFLFRSRVDLMHAHENSSLWALAFWVLVLRRRAVWDPHDYFHEPRVRQRGFTSLTMQMFLERSVVRRGTPIMAVSDGMRKQYANLYPDARVDVLRNYSSDRNNAIEDPGSVNEVARRLVESRAQFGKGMLRLIYPGLIKPERFSLDLIRAIGTMPGISLDIYGEDRSTSGKNQSALEKTLSENRIRNVHLRGRYTSDTIVSILGQYHFVMLPYEVTQPNIDFCLPNKFYQCIEAGLPLITSNMREMGDIIAKYGLGYIFPSGDNSACTEIIANCTTHGDEYFKLVHNVLSYQSNELDYRQQQAQFLGAYSAALERG